MAQQALSVCMQQTSESSATFANSLHTLLHAATTGLDPATQKERVMEELVARLRCVIRYYAKLDYPSFFEQAVSKAQMVELLRAEVTAGCLVTPLAPPRPIEVKTAASSRFRPRRDHFRGSATADIHETLKKDLPNPLQLWRQRTLRSAVPFITEPAQTHRYAFL
uniref:Mediator complex subunit 15 n=1 Tax=Haemonchus contortus TaxID=6289 RepID=A0A7I4YDX8_HAECO